jgi:hypothetical protein
MAELNLHILNLFFYAGISVLNVSFKSLKGTLKAVKESVVSCFVADKYSLLCECRASDVQLS